MVSATVRYGSIPVDCRAVPFMEWAPEGMAPAVSQGPAAREAAFGRMPPRNPILAQPPAQEHLPAFDPGGEVDQTLLRISQDDVLLGKRLHLLPERVERVPILLADGSAAVQGGGPPQALAACQDHLPGALDAPERRR